MVANFLVELSDGRTIQVFDSENGTTPLLWHPGSPHTGTPLPPVLEAANERDIRVVTYARPGYGRSTRNPGRDVASAASDAAAVLDTLDLDRVHVAGYSGGGPHALACAALLPDRVIAAVTLASPAPY